MNDEDQAEVPVRPVQVGPRKSDGNLWFNTADLDDMLKEDSEHDPLILALEGVWAQGSCCVVIAEWSHDTPFFAQALRCSRARTSWSSP